MHAQILVIHPKDVSIEDVMYPYQEIDKTQQDKMGDERCVFFLEVAEEDIPSFLNQIKEHTESKIKEYGEIIQYRSEHSYEETIEKYGRNSLKSVFELYRMYCDDLLEYYQIKDLPYDHPKQISFIKQNGYHVADKWVDFYIKGKGYGTWHNPYEIWDYYTMFEGPRFPNDFYFLIGKHGLKSNQMDLVDLDVKETIKYIHDITYVWEYILFCKEKPSDSELYTTDKIRFDRRWNEHCVVDNLEEILTRLSKEPSEYIVTALDFHW